MKHFIAVISLIAFISCSETPAPFDPSQPDKTDKKIERFLSGEEIYRPDGFNARHRISGEPLWIDTEAAWKFHKDEHYEFTLTLTDSGRINSVWAEIEIPSDTLQYETGHWTVRNQSVLFQEVKGEILQPDGSKRTYDTEASYFPIQFWGYDKNDPLLFIEFGKRGNKYKLRQ